jgi:glycosyltransferase involved in cell wall biosynthesis
MQIAIDATPLLLRSAGVKTYTHNLLLHLRRLAEDDTILAWPYLDPGEAYSHEESATGRAGTLARVALLHAANYSYLPLLDWIGPRVDVFHTSHQLRNPPRKARLTATLYDMTCWLAPETHKPRNVWASRLFADRVLARADALIAISESTRMDAIRILGLVPEKVVVIYPGVAEAFFRTTPEETRRAAQRFRLDKPYALFVGTVEPRKNLDTLLDAWTQVSPALREEYDLVVAGPEGWGDQRTLARLRSAGGGVRYLGYVPEVDLPGLTAGATIFVYPSLYEGFGLPLGQAMAAGVPVITSDVSSMPEVAGEAGLLVDPRSPSQIADSLERLLPDVELRLKLGRQGIERARRYRWEVSARQTLDFFHRFRG